MGRRILVAGLAGLLFAVLFAGFGWNTWGAASSANFALAQRGSEGVVLGRLAVARARGFAAMGGLLGFVGEGSADVVTFDTDELFHAFDPNGQARFYCAPPPVSSFGPYLSQSGLQGSALVLLDRGLGALAPETRLDVFHALTAGLLAAALAAALVFLGRELGSAAALCALAVVLASPWLAALGRNLYLSLWLFALPPLAIGLALGRGERHGKGGGEGRRLALATFLGLLPRFLAGFEFVTAALALAGGALVYVSLRDGVGARVLLRRGAIAAGASVLALVLALALLTLQIRQVTSSFGAAFQHLEFALGRRTHGDPARFPPAYANALRTDTSTVLRFYLGDAFDRDAAEKPAVLRAWLARSPRDGLTVVLAAAGWALVRARHLAEVRRRRVLGLTAATGVAWLGMLAWLVIFKSHSFNHGHVDPVHWHLGPFLLGAALVGWTLEDVARLGWRALAARRAPPVT